MMTARSFPRLVSMGVCVGLTICPAVGGGNPRYVNPEQAERLLQGVYAKPTRDELMGWGYILAGGIGLIAAGVGTFLIARRRALSGSEALFRRSLRILGLKRSECALVRRIAKSSQWENPTSMLLAPEALRAATEDAIRRERLMGPAAERLRVGSQDLISVLFPA